MNRSLKVFFASGVPFGIFIGILYSSLYGLSTGLASGLSAGLIFGFLMFIILCFLHTRAVKKITGEKSGEAIGICHVRNIRLPFPYDRTFDLCIESLNLIDRCRVQQDDRSGGKIIAKSSVNWKTWGDTIYFDIDRTDSEETHVKVSSRPTSWTTIVDYGKNLQNVETIVSFLNKAGEVAGR